MRVYLHPDFCLRGSKLWDTHLGALYQLSPDAVWLLKRLHKNAELRKLVSAVVVRRSVSEYDARAAALAFYAQLGRVGAARVRWHEYSSGWRLRAWATWRQREHPTLRGCMKSMLRAYGWPILLGTGTCFVFGKIGNLPLVYSLLPIILFGSCIVHELGHVLATKWCNIPAVVLSCVGYSAVCYNPGDRRLVVMLISAAGPAAGLGACLLGLLFAPNLLLPLVMVAAAHMMCLSPWSADGRALWQALAPSKVR